MSDPAWLDRNNIEGALEARYTPKIWDELAEAMWTEKPCGRVAYIDVLESDQYGDNRRYKAIIDDDDGDVVIRCRSGSAVGFQIEKVTVREKETVQADPVNPLKGSW